MNAMTKIGAADLPASPDKLQIFNHVPHHHGVVAVDLDDGCPLIPGGEVAVYDEWDLRYNPLQEGALYVWEYQRTPAAMPRQQFAEAFVEYAARLDIRREIVRVARWAGKDKSRWCIHPMKAVQGGIFVFSDGPFEEFYVTNSLIGKVVGVYRPHIN
ncbi:hypothetical protein [Sphingobium indicum]